MLPPDFRWRTANPYETDERAVYLGTVEVARYTQKVTTGFNVMVDRQRREADERGYADAPDRDTARHWIEAWATRDADRIRQEVADYNAGLAGWVRR